MEVSVVSFVIHATALKANSHAKAPLLHAAFPHCTAVLGRIVVFRSSVGVEDAITGDVDRCVCTLKMVGDALAVHSGELELPYSTEPQTAPA